MKHSKRFYQQLTLPTGFKWGFFNQNLHSFLKEEFGQFLEIRVTEHDIEVGDHLNMMQKGLTR